MWEEQKQKRFQQLRERENVLTEAERAELARLLEELEAEEAGYLAPATNRLHAERETLERQNRTLEVLVRRNEALLLRLRDFLAEARAERHAIKRELDAVLAEGRGSETEG